MNATNRNPKRPRMAHSLSFCLSLLLLVSLAAFELTAIHAHAATIPSVKSCKGITVVQSGNDWVTVNEEEERVNYTGIAQNHMGWWRVENGKVNFKATGIYQNDYGWWRVENGKVNFNANSIYSNAYGWWKTTGGRVTWDENGVFQNDYGWWKVENSKVNFDFYGVASNQYGTWFLDHGKVNFNMNGYRVIDGKKYKITKGKATLVEANYVATAPTSVVNAFKNAGANTSSYKSSHNYCFAVNTNQNIVIAYQQDANGNFTKPVKAFIASCGLAKSPTKTGTYKTTDTYTWRALNGGVYGQYATRITGHYLFHSVPYKSQNKAALKTAEYNKLGSPASEGCIRLSVADAKWIQERCPSGTIVTLYNDANICEPLERPTAITIDTDSPYAGWDPTDPDSRNPWH